MNRLLERIRSRAFVHSVPPASTPGVLMKWLRRTSEFDQLLEALDSCTVHPAELVRFVGQETRAFALADHCPGRNRWLS